MAEYRDDACASRTEVKFSGGGFRDAVANGDGGRGCGVSGA